MQRAVNHRARWSGSILAASIQERDHDRDRRAGNLGQTADDPHRKLPLIRVETIVGESHRQAH
jgi:hypothetical protein